MSLHVAARSANMSPFYFCKAFKKATGLTFTGYLARTRIESVKSLLLNVHVNVSGATYAAGSRSLSRFNRVFRRVAGESPSDYRLRIHGRHPPAGRCYVHAA
ncbi:MAG TPA: helix-turn-helix transcriptional regulator [Opitutus sp.]|nr:helix-turn-helix transcriptional regulator [Opitutus sp.]